MMGGIGSGRRFTEMSAKELIVHLKKKTKRINELRDYRKKKKKSLEQLSEISEKDRFKKFQKSIRKRYSEFHKRMKELSAPAFEWEVSTDQPK